MWLRKKAIAYSESYDTYIYQKKMQKDPIKKKAKIDFFNKANISIFLCLLDISIYIKYTSFIECHTHDGLLLI